jgi:hypothetical protein
MADEKDELLRGGYTMRWSVVSLCGARGPGAKTKHEAIAAWNQRA